MDAPGRVPDSPRRQPSPTAEDAIVSAALASPPRPRREARAPGLPKMLARRHCHESDGSVRELPKIETVIRQLACHRNGNEPY